MSSIVTIDMSGDRREGEAAMLRRVLDLSTSALTYWDAGATCRYANRAALDWFGVAPEFLEGSGFDALADVAGLRSHRAYAQSAQRGEARAVVHAFAHPCGARLGLVRYLPDVVRGVTSGFVVQVSVTPAELRLDA